ncbi:MAG: RnfABCDGE type electron transport complex subunit D [Nitrosomonas sp.]|nr:RnfABCDGE type electron transport complex subunit D [Nitrosomonas sp.]
MLNKTLNIATSPHIVKGISTVGIMKNVVWALLPVSVFAVYSFGLSALMLLITTTFSAVLTEHVLCRISQKESTISDWSAVITGLLLGLTLPPNFPLWMAFLGGVISIALGKFAFGGLGCNVFNPALVGRAVLQAAFPVAITTWYPAFLPERFTTFSAATFTFPFTEPATDGFTGATPLAAFKFEQVTTATPDLALGLITGSTGETCAVLIFLGGIYLIARNMMNWRIPVSILSTVFALSGILYLVDNQVYPSPFFMLFSGGLMLGAMFMATDMVGSPITPLGVWLYGIIIGLLVVVIRMWGGLPEGVMYAILLGNALSPHIDNLIRPKVYGTSTRGSKHACKVSANDTRQQPENAPGDGQYRVDLRPHHRTDFSGHTAEDSPTQGRSIGKGDLQSYSGHGSEKNISD